MCGLRSSVPGPRWTCRTPSSLPERANYGEFGTRLAGICGRRDSPFRGVSPAICSKRGDGWAILLRGHAGGTICIRLWSAGRGAVRLGSSQLP